MRSRNCAKFIGARSIPSYADKNVTPRMRGDLIQGFFADLIETRAYARANREKGRFRSFLLGTLKHFVADMRDRGRALKRGGGMILYGLGR